MQVLIVDDDESVCNSMSAALMLAGHSVDYVTDPSHLPPLNAVDVEVLICDFYFESLTAENVVSLPGFFSIPNRFLVTGSELADLPDAVKSSFSACFEKFGFSQVLKSIDLAAAQQAG